ncbi:TetR/AcrR family transcriptional regulator [Streptomyces sp. WAC06614]|uniref:TetR/AcrR family transcriptional regulator n=1 Tax=Streptomyces sp. WAC06614 TaxID=2487416 RepID=UPI000F7B64B2|nr:TetR family transcriptional regulator C-terminal domain-containing protein [Streptomyces sp. WAC06614]RSS61171.1 TetR family transcriptional regulator [Streptomyces sp. WAC06614]
MPKQVDHEGRRVLVAEAVLALADERGLEGVTLRDVAARAEVSMGAVQRCFRTKEEMLVFALAHIGERITARARTAGADGTPGPPRAALGRLAAEVSLLGEERRAEARIWLAFLAQAVVSEPLARTLRADYAALEDAFTRLVAEAGGDEGPGGARRAARTLLALTDGLTAHVLVGHLTPDGAQEVLDGHLAGLLGG